MLIVTAIVLIGWQLATFLVAKFFFRHTRQQAGIACLSAGAPTVGYLGTAVLSPLFGAEAALTVAVAALVVNLAQVPLGVTHITPTGTSPVAALMEAIQQPVVLSPLIATAMVVAGIRFPTVADTPLELIGHATSGVAVFAAGVALSAHKLRFNIEIAWNVAIKLMLMPASILALGRALGIGTETLEQSVLIAALPPVFAGMILAVRYHTNVEMASSTLIMSVLLFAVSPLMWIAIERSLDA